MPNIILNKMAFIVKKTIKDNEYYYLNENKRVDGKVKTKTFLEFIRYPFLAKIQAKQDSRSLSFYIS